MLDRFKKDNWRIALRKRNDKLLFESGGASSEFIPLKNTIRYWCADPFLIDYNGRKYLFFELYDRIKRKGLIGYREIIAGKPGKIHKAYETNAHLSYPFIFEKDGYLFIIPESNNLNKLILLRNKMGSKKLKFEKIKDIIDGSAVADTTFFKFNDEYYMVTTPVTDSGNADNLELYFCENDNLISADFNPIVNDKSTARMAGRFITHDGKLIRCSQNCMKTYGGGINFAYVNECSRNAYSETVFMNIAPDDVNIKNVKCREGIHTYNYDDEYEVIDYKVRKFTLTETLGWLLQKLHVFKKETRNGKH